MIYKIKSNDNNNDYEAIEIECKENRVMLEVQELNLETLDWECRSFISVDVNEFLFVTEQIKNSISKSGEK